LASLLLLALALHLVFFGRLAQSALVKDTDGCGYLSETVDLLLITAGQSDRPRRDFFGPVRPASVRGPADLERLTPAFTSAFAHRHTGPVVANETVLSRFPKLEIVFVLRRRLRSH